MNKAIELSERDAHQAVRKEFARILRLDLERPEHRHMAAEAELVRERMQDVSVRGILRYLPKDAYRDGVIRVLPEQADTAESGESCSGCRISCTYFENIPSEIVEGIYLFVLTAGECRLPEGGRTTDLLYADVWANSYLEAGRRFLQARLAQDMRQRLPGREVKLSGTFGPGYYGMDLREAVTLHEILGGRKAGISVDEHGVFTPAKSLSGVVFVLNDIGFEEEEACLHCVGSAAGCGFCAMRGKEARR